MISFAKNRFLWLVGGLAGIFVMVSLVNNTLYPFPSPLAYVLFVIQTPALIAGALVTGRDSINWVVFYVALFCTYMIVFSPLIFIYQIVLAKVGLKFGVKAKFYTGPLILSVIT
jgi:hypothetical protein